MISETNFFKNFSIEQFAVALYDGTPKKVFSKHSNYSDIIIYIKSGEMDVTVKDKTYHFTSGDWVIIPKFFNYRSDWHGDNIISYNIRYVISKTLVTKNTYSIKTDFSEYDSMQDGVVKIMSDHPESEYLIEQIYKNYISTDDNDNALAISDFYRLWITIRKKLSKTERPHDIQKIIDKLESNLLSGFDIQSLCDAGCMSKSSLFGKFKAATGKTPVQYRNDLLARLGNEMLKAGNMSIEEISRFLNLCSPNYFVVIYKKYYGFSPRKLIKNPLHPDIPSENTTFFGSDERPLDD